MSRKGKVFFEDKFAGIISEDENGYTFEYDKEYLINKGKSISLTLPASIEVHTSKTMLPFFDGLIPEGWLLNIAAENWKIDPRDRMGLLITVCKDCIGEASILPVEEKTNE